MTAVDSTPSPSPNTLKMTHPTPTTTNTALIPYPRYAIITILTPAFVAPLEALRYIAAGWRVKYARPMDAGVVTASKLFGTLVPGMRGYGFGHQSGDLKALQNASKGEADVLSLAVTEDLEGQDAEKEENRIEYPAVKHDAVEEATAEEVVMENDVEEEEAILKALDSFFEQQDNTTSIPSTFIAHLDPVEFEFIAPLIAAAVDGETENVTEKPTIQGELESVDQVSPAKSQAIHADEVPAEDQVVMNDATANGEPIINHEHAADESTFPTQHNNTYLQATPINMIEECEAATKESIVVEKEEVIQNEPGSKQIITPAEHDGIQSDATHITSIAVSTFDFNKSKSTDFTFRAPPTITTPAGQDNSINKSEAIPTSATGSLFGTNKLKASDFTFAASQHMKFLPLTPPIKQETTQNADETVTQGTTTEATSDPIAMDWEPTNQQPAVIEKPASTETAHRSTQPTQHGDHGAGTKSSLLPNGEPATPTVPRTLFTFTAPLRTTTASTCILTFPPTLFGLGNAAPTPTRFGTAALRGEAFTFSVGEGAGKLQRRCSGESSGSGGVSGVFSSEGAGGSSASSVGSEDEAVMEFLERAFRGGGKIKVSGEERKKGGKAQESGGRKKGAKKGKKKSENKNASWGMKGGKKN